MSPEDILSVLDTDMTEYLYDNVEAGDLNPVRDGHGREMCLATPSKLSGYRCTRPEGHSGQHVAEGMQKTECVWPQEETK